MNQEKIARINELAKKKKDTGLTEEELAEQHCLRMEYLAAVRENARASLEQLRKQSSNGKGCSQR